METTTVRIEKLVEGGKGMGRDRQKRAIFTQGVLPTELVKVRIDYAKKRFAEATLLEIIEPARERIATKCNHAGKHNECGFQHAAYATQLKSKTQILRDQLIRVAKLKKPPVRPILPNPTPWDYRIETTFSMTPDGQLGYWSPIERKLLAVSDCHTMHRTLRAAKRMVDLDIDGLRKMTLRMGADDAVQLVLNMNDAEPPELASDIPVSVAIVMPDGVAATLIGDPFLTQVVKDREFRVSAGSFFHPSIAGAALLVDTVLEMAYLRGTETIIECFSGVGLLTSFLADGAKEVIGIEKNADSVEDAATNLDATENVALYNAWIEDVLPSLDVSADMLVIDVGTEGITNEAIAKIMALGIPRLIVSCWDIGVTANVAAELTKSYHLTKMQPIDMLPQTIYTQTVSHWQRR